MKPKFRSLIATLAPIRGASLVACASLCAISNVHAAEQKWTGVTDNFWTTAGNWNSGFPSIGDIAVFDDTSTANPATTLGLDTSIQGLKVVSPLGAVSVAAGNTLTLGSAGIDMSATTQDVTLGSGVTLLGSTNQAWSVAAGRTLNLTGALTRQAGGTLDVTNLGTINIAGLTASTAYNYGVYGGTDYLALDASKNAAPAASVITYVANPSTGAALPSTSSTAAWYDIVKSNTNGTTAFRLSSNMTATNIRFNTAHTNSQNWTVDINARNLSCSSVLVTQAVGARNVQFNSNSSGTGSFRLGAGAELQLHQYNTLGDLVINAQINHGAGAGATVTKDGPGRVIFALDSTGGYLGVTRVLEGTLQIGNGGATGNLNAASSVINQGVLAFNRNNALNFVNAISGPGQVTVAMTGSSGVLTLSGTNTFTGGTSINSGAVRIAADVNLGAGNITLAGGTLVATETFTLDSSRSLFLTANSTLDVAVTKTLTFNGNLSGTSNLNVTGTGILSLGGASRDYSGLITVSDGELRLTSANLLANASINQTGGKLVFGGGTPQAPLEVFVPKFSGSGGEITVGENTVAVLSYEGNTLQSYGGQIRGSGGIRKQGSGLITLSGKNDFTGQADIDDGTLLIGQDGLLAGPAVIANTAMLIVNGAALSIVQVDAGGTLGGNGVIGGFASIEGIHRPGNSPGVQTFADGASYASTSSFEWDLVQNFSDPTGRGTAYDGVNVTASQLFIAAGAQSELRFNLEGSTVNWSNSFWATDQQWLVFDNASAPSGIFGTPSLTVDSAGATLASSRPNATFSWGQTGNDIYLNYSIPEPTSALFTIAGMLCLSLRRRR